MGQVAITRPAGSSSGAAGSTGRARFRPRPLVAVVELRESSSSTTAGPGAGTGAAAPATTRAELGGGPSSIVSQTSPSDEEEAGPATAGKGGRATPTGAPAAGACCASWSGPRARASSAAAQGSRDDRAAVGREAASPATTGADALASRATATLPWTAAGAVLGEAAGGRTTDGPRRGPAASEPGSGGAKIARA